MSALRDRLPGVHPARRSSVRGRQAGSQGGAGAFAKRDFTADGVAGGTPCPWARHIRSLPGRGEETQISVLSAIQGRPPRNDPAFLHENWADDSEREKVMKTMLPGATIRLLPQRDCPHARSLELRWADGRHLKIVLDQGLGAWRTSGRRPTPFDGSVPPQAQAKVLGSIDVAVEMQDGGRVASPMWVTWGDDR